MAQIDLKYGSMSLPLEYDPSGFEVLAPDAGRTVLSDAEIGSLLDQPIGSATIEDLIEPGASVLIVVPDATREVGCGQVINLVVRRLIATGVNAFDIRIIFATGIHRRATDDEKAAIVTPFIAQRIKMLDHDPRDLMQIAGLGRTAAGIPIEVNRALLDHDHVIVIGGISFHYFAGFTGGRKSICPGLASSRTIAATHKLAFDCERLARRDGVGPGRLDGNTVNEAFEVVAAAAPPSFAINTFVDDHGNINGLYCGDYRASHRAACEIYGDENSIRISEKRSTVIVSCGGSPHDLNMIQAHKALDAAASACTDGGKIFLFAECGDGLGRPDFLDWFSAATSGELGARLCEKYQVNGQTAFSLLQKTERFEVHLVSSLAADTATKMRFLPATADDIIKAARESSGYIIPGGAKVKITAC